MDTWTKNNNSLISYSLLFQQRGSSQTTAEVNSDRFIKPKINKGRRNKPFETAAYDHWELTVAEQTQLGCSCHMFLVLCTNINANVARGREINDSKYGILLPFRLNLNIYDTKRHHTTGPLILLKNLKEVTKYPQIWYCSKIQYCVFL